MSMQFSNPEDKLSGEDIKRHKHGVGENGQSLVIVALLMIFFAGILALALDGGYAYFYRRTAQVAADAGALAGAREYCQSNDTNTAQTVAIDYAVTRNRATSAAVDFGYKVITVTTTIPFNTFFAGLLGHPNGTVSATAAAGCFSPGAGTGVLPVAWACSPIVTGGTSNITGTVGTCDIEYGTYDPPVPGPLYVIMDDDQATDIYCQDPVTGLPTTGLDCDLDDDMVNDIFAGGDRSWLDLGGGGGGASNLSNWILNGFSGTLNMHTWLGGQTGVANSIFQSAEQRVGDVVVLPVFDMFCDLGTPSINCSSLYHYGTDSEVIDGGSLYYHIVTFSAFRITCVDAPGARPPGGCPGHNAVKAVNPGLHPNFRTIEGYFIHGYVPGLSGKPGGGIDAGAYSIYLLK